MNAMLCRALALFPQRVLAVITLLGYAMCAPTMAAEIATVEVEIQVFNLDVGETIERFSDDLTEPTGGDLGLAYNADRAPHAVAIPATEGVEMAFVSGIGFDGISATDIPNLIFSQDPTDLPFSAEHCVVVRTDEGAVFKIGNAVENGSSVTFNYERIQ